LCFLIICPMMICYQSTSWKHIFHIIFLYTYFSFYVMKRYIYIYIFFLGLLFDDDNILSTIPSSLGVSPYIKNTVKSRISSCYIDNCSLICLYAYVFVLLCARYWVLRPSSFQERDSYIFSCLFILVHSFLVCIITTDFSYY